LDTNDKLAQALYDEISQLWVIDAHEHLVDEAERLAWRADAVSAFTWYPEYPLKAAGMNDEEYAIFQNIELPVEERWQVFGRYLPLIRTTSFARSVLLGLRELYGFGDLTAENYQQVSEAMHAANTPGIYRRVFRDHGRVAAVLNQRSGFADSLPAPGNFRIPQMWASQFLLWVRTDALRRIEVELGRTVRSLQEYGEALPELVAHYRKRGIVGIKAGHVIMPQANPAAAEVAPVFDRVLQAYRAGQQELEGLAPAERDALRDYAAHILVRTAGELGLPVSYHTGFEGTWEDFRECNPSRLIPVFLRYRDTRFDIYHSGTVWDREVGMIGLSCPNVWINQCWAHGLSKEMTRAALDGWLDMVPSNKIIAFGGDTLVQIEGSLGDLIQVRELISSVLARRIREGVLTEEQALELANRMLYENPKELYRLSWGRPGELVYA